MTPPYGMFGYRDDRTGFVKAGVDKELAKATAAKEGLLYFQLIPTDGQHSHLAYKRRPDGGYTTKDWSTRRGVFSNLLSIGNKHIPTKEQIL